jgi:hypothetical protein
MALPVLAQIYCLCAGVGCLTVLIGATTGALHHGHGHTPDGGGSHGHGHGADHGHGDHAGEQTRGHVVKVKKTQVAVDDRDRLGVAILTWLNPNTIAAFATWFGAIGIILWRTLPIPILWTLPIALIGGVFGAKLTLNFVGFLGSRMYESGTFSTQDVIGLQAEVTVPVSDQGMGEVVYVKGGRRDTASARVNKPEISLARGTMAIICDIRDDVAYVEPWSDFALTASEQA